MNDDANKMVIMTRGKGRGTKKGSLVGFPLIESVKFILNC